MHNMKQLYHENTKMILKRQCIQTATVNPVQYVRMEEEEEKNPS